VFPREDRDLSKGLASFASPPRFATGYAAVQNRPSLLIETHMLKSYKVRVSATYDILAATLGLMNSQSSTLRSLNREADARAAHMGASGTTFMSLTLDTTGIATPMEFHGVKSRIEFSDISGSERIIYSHQPVTLTIPYYNDVRTIDSILVPRYYIVPREWTRVLEVLDAHDITMYTLASPLTIEVEKYVLTKPEWREKPFEGRHAVKCSQTSNTETHTVPAGSVVVPTDRRTARVIVNLLEPRGPDSFVSWGFFDAIFEQKEYAEDYVLEKLALSMIEKNPALGKEFNAKVTSDSAFAHDHRARLNFFYQHSPYWDTTLGIYPIVRVMNSIDEKLIKKKFVPGQ
jgi:hypothetical protein